MSWPTTDEPRTVFATVRFTEREGAEIEEAVREHYPDRSAFLRAASEREVARLARLSKKKQKQKGGDPA